MRRVCFAVLSVVAVGLLTSGCFGFDSLLDQGAVCISDQNCNPGDGGGEWTQFCYVRPDAGKLGDPGVSGHCHALPEKTDMSSENDMSK